jgi:putative flippase GtrA
MSDGLVRRLLGFATAGALGFAVDAGLTEALVALGVGPYAARVVAVAAAIAVTYAVNRGYTWKRHADAAPAAGRKARYLAVSLASTALNYAVYALAITANPALRPAIAVACGSAVAMVSNYLGYSRLVFPSRTPPDQVA